MRTTTLDRIVTLQKRRQQQGRNSTAAIDAELQVYGAVKPPGLSFRSNMAAAGFEIDYTVTLWRCEFQSDAYTHVIIDGDAYRIVNTGNGINDQFVNVAVRKMG